MASFQYVAQTDQGAIERGRIVGTSPSDARSRLSGRGRRVLNIQKAESAVFERKLSLPIKVVRRVRSSDIELLLQQLAVMLESGLTLVDSLRELSVHSPNKRQQDLCARLATLVEQGTSFVPALEKVGCFPPIVIQLARVGEETGELAATLQRAAEFLNVRRQATSGLLSALAYPLFTAAAACSVATYLVGWVIPKLATFLHAMGRKLPAMTQSLLDISAFVKQHGTAAGIVVASLIVGIAFCYTWPPGRHWIDRFLLRIPGVGMVLRMAGTHLLATSLALMLRSGVFLTDALKIATTLHSNRYLASRVQRAQEDVARGKNLASCLEGFGYVELLPSLIAVGERTGNLPHALEHVASYCENQVAAKIKRFGRLIEPVLIVVVGGIVGYVYSAFFIALMSAGGKF